MAPDHSRLGLENKFLENKLGRFFCFRPSLLCKILLKQPFILFIHQSWAFSETVQKISKITYIASRFSLLTSAKFAVNINRVTPQHNKEFIMFFYLMVL